MHRKPSLTLRMEMGTKKVMLLLEVRAEPEWCCKVESGEKEVMWVKGWEGQRMSEIWGGQIGRSD